MLHSLVCIALSLVLCVTAQQPERVQCNNPNEEWTACGARCGESCADQGKQIACPMMCALAGGCSCKEGYARDANRQCIPKSQCPQNSGSGGKCPPGVSLVNCFVDPCMTATCPGQPNARCEADYCGGCNTKWFLNGQDVTSRCRSTNNINCGANEEYLPCGSACPPQCGDEIMGACIAMCKSGCFCKSGLVRGPNNRCIRRSECPNSSNGARCAAMLCIAGTVCEEDRNGARCVPQAKITCANVRCAGPCEETPTGPRCRPRNSTDVCSGNPCGHLCQRCIPEPKACFTAPCPQYRCEHIPGCLGPPISVNKTGKCPEPRIGVCVELCQNDAGCEGNQKCCSNGCGHVCMAPISRY